MLSFRLLWKISCSKHVAMVFKSEYERSSYLKAFWELQEKNFEFLFIANLQAFLVKIHIYFNLFIVDILLFYNNIAIF